VILSTMKNMQTTPKIKHGDSSGSPTPACCASLNLALALHDVGSQHEADPIKWTDAAFALSDHCIGREDVTDAALRIVVDAYRNTLAILASPSSVHINMLRGTIAWTPEHLRHVLGDSLHNVNEQESP
jgi:hypothetical protein